MRNWEGLERESGGPYKDEYVRFSCRWFCRGVLRRRQNTYQDCPPKGQEAGTFIDQLPLLLVEDCTQGCQLPPHIWAVQVCKPTRVFGFDTGPGAKAERWLCALEVGCSRDKVSESLLGNIHQNCGRNQSWGRVQKEPSPTTEVKTRGGQKGYDQDHHTYLTQSQRAVLSTREWTSNKPTFPGHRLHGEEKGERRTTGVALTEVRSLNLCKPCGPRHLKSKI